MHPDINSDVSVSPLKVCFLLVYPKHDYYLQIWKNSTTTRKTLQCSELVRVKHGNIRIFSGSTIHGEGFLNSKSTGNARIQLHVYKKSHSGANINNRYFKDYDFKNVTAKQLKLYNFEQSKQHFLKESNDFFKYAQIYICSSKQ